MRRASVLAAALVLAPLPAAADVTARYDAGTERLAIEVDDGGDYRAEIAGKFALMRRAGIEYVVIFQGSEALVVERQVMFDLLKAKLATGAPPPSGKTYEAAVAKGGEEEIAGRRGTLWTLSSNVPGGNKIEVVMSPDRDLAPVGAVFASMSDAAMKALAGLLPGPGIEEKWREIFARGTPLRIKTIFDMRLSSVSAAAIDPARFVLPGPVLDGAAFDRAMSSAREPAEVSVEVPPPPPLP